MSYRLSLLALMIAAAAGTAFAKTQPAPSELVPVTATRNVDTYGAPSATYTPAHTDTCNGDIYTAYVCPPGVAKTCVDVRFQLAPATNSNTTYTLCSPNCPSDSCDGNTDNGFSCPTTSPVPNQIFSKFCTDVKKMGGVRYKSSFSCVISNVWIDVAVKCVQ